MKTAQQRLEEIAAQEKALADERVKILAASKEDDLDLVKRLCKQHGFTATQLKGCLAGRGRKKKTADPVTKKSGARKTAAKKSAKAK